MSDRRARAAVLIVRFSADATGIARFRVTKTSDLSALDEDVLSTASCEEVIGVVTEWLADVTVA